MRMAWFGACLLALAGVGFAGCRRHEVVEAPPAPPQPHVTPEPPRPAPADPWADMKQRLPSTHRLPRAAQRRLAKNGFVVLAGYPVFDVTDAYFEAHTPFITSDAVLYVFGCLFRGGLLEYEKEKLVPLLETLVEQGLRAAEADYTQRKEQKGLRDPARRNLLLFGVAAELLGKRAPSEVRAEARQIADKIVAAEEADYYPGEDYTIYLVRGQYEEHPELAGYFRATKWLGRYIMPLLPGIEDRAESNARLRQAVLLGLRLREHTHLQSSWQRLFDELSFFMAAPDCITPLQVVEGTDNALGSGYADGDRPELGTDAALEKLRAEFSKDEYPASAIMPVPQTNPGDLPEKYCQVLGERYILDGEITQRTVYPYIFAPRRWLPSALDVAATVLDFNRAYDHLVGEFERYPQLEGQLDKLRQEFSGFGREPEAPERRPIYQQWLAALRTLSDEVPDGAPKFMSTDAWEDKQLNTALASWAQLRHDFILHAKQPVTPAAAGIEVLVEPVPELYGRVETMAGALDRRGFEGMAELARLCKNLRLAAQAQLAGEWFEYAHLDKNYAFYISSFGQWLLAHFTKHVAVQDPTMVADLHSTLLPVDLALQDPTVTAGKHAALRPGQKGEVGGVLHVATGPLYPIIAEWQAPSRGGEGERRKEHVMGFVMSYHEWQTWTPDAAERMTDEQWREEVRRKRNRKRMPEWTSSFMLR